MYLRCHSNNLAETVLDLFLNTVRKDGDRWPSRIRVDRRVENVLVCDVMVQFRGEGRASLIAGPSTQCDSLCKFSSMLPNLCKNAGTAASTSRT